MSHATKYCFIAGNIANFATKRLFQATESWEKTSIESKVKTNYFYLSFSAIF
jgi:hypothetical protein